MADNGSLQNQMKRSGSGCAVYVVTFAGVSYLLDHLTAPHLMADARPWVGIVAGAFLTLGLASLWGMLTGATRGGGKAALLANAQTPGLPDKDGPMLATGTVRLDEAFGEALTAPLSATPCVAYWYRMYSITSTASEHRREVPVYWGAACIPFRIESPLRSVRVVAVPSLADGATQMKLEIHVNRAKAFLQSAHLEQVSGIGGALGTAFSIVDDVLAGENQQYRRDWARKGPAIDPSQLLLEETVLAVGVNATVVGPWSVTRQAIVPHVEGLDALSVSIRTGAGGAADANPDTVGLGVAPSPLAGWITTLGLLASAAGILWGALKLLSGP